MIIYAGERKPNGFDKIVAVRDTDTGETKRFLNTKDAEDMNWGYGGSGPALFARVLVDDCVRREILPAAARDYAYQFKWDIVAQMGERWQLTERQIKDWWEKTSREQFVPVGTGELLRVMELETGGMLNRIGREMAA